ncbi:MAG: sigma-54-dependent Fis family transcriptional regulator [Pseudomonadales bacterium]|nr:sigma-54-dependent Fis family transcriptional regulator [Pseudomonadales bacterium]
MSDSKVLLIEDSLTLATVYQEYLSDEMMNITAVESGSDALKQLSTSAFDLVLLDLNLPDMHGLDILAYMQKQGIEVQVVIMTAHGSVDIAVDAMRFGVFDFLTKPFDAKRLLVTVRNALKQAQLHALVDNYREHYDREDFHGFIGASLPMQGVYRIIESAAPSTATVFITGESGTGKELCAEAIHKQSPRKNKAFIALNCAAIPKDLMESEIFGHVKGAFTGALNQRDGAASLADGGTLFLDELCEMDLDLQSKILRFIQTGTFNKVGSSKPEKVDVRFVCATNRDPLKEVEQGRFREDLYYRLHVIPITLPPLRQRDNDILIIAQRFLDQYSKEENKAFKKFDAGCKQQILQYDWPGNIRQLQNVIRNLVVLNDVEVVSTDILPPPLNQQLAQRIVSTVAHESTPLHSSSSMVSQNSVQHVVDNAAILNIDIQPLLEVERQAIEQAIAFCDGNIPRAAALLEVSPSTIYRKKQAWDGA